MRKLNISAKELYEMIKNNEPFVILDVRTPKEIQEEKVIYKDTLEIPMNELFKEKNLSRLPKEKKIVVVCHKGGRSEAVALELKSLGFKNIFSLKGGLSALSPEVNILSRKEN